MPRVPTYDNFQVSDSAPPAVRFDAPQAQNAAPKQGQDMGNALMSAGGAMARIQQDIDQTRVSESMNSLMEQRLALTYKDGGFTHLAGKDALERPDNKSLSQEYGERLKKYGDDITSRLGNDRQKKMFNEQLSKVMLEFDGDITRHVAGESRKWQLSVHEGTQKTAINYAAANWGDTSKVEQSRNAVKQSVYDKGSLIGKSAVEIQADQVDALSVMHSAVMTAAVDSKNIDYAREYYKQNESELNAPTRLNLTKLLEAGDFEKRTQDKTDELWAKYGGDTKAAIAEARKDKTLDGKVEDAVISRLKTIAQEEIALREQAQRNVADKAWKYVANGQVPPISLMNQLDGRDEMAIKNAMSGAETKTNPEAYYALTVQAAQNPAEFKGQDLRRFFDVLSPADRKHFIDMQSSMAKDEEYSQVVSVEAQKSAMISKLNLKDADKGVFSQTADRALFDAMQQKGGKLNQDERQKVLDRLVLEGQTPGSWFGTNDIRAYEAMDQGREFTPVWNDDQLRKARASLAKRGNPNPTDKQLNDLLTIVYGTQE